MSYHLRLIAWALVVFIMEAAFLIAIPALNRPAPSPTPSPSPAVSTSVAPTPEPAPSSDPAAAPGGAMTACQKATYWHTRAFTYVGKIDAQYDELQALYYQRECRG